MHASLGGVSTGGSGLLYVSRGILAHADFASAIFTKDGAWHTLSIAGLIPVDAKFVIITVSLVATAANKFFYVAQHGDTSGYNALVISTQVSGVWKYGVSPPITVDANRRVDYYITTGTYSQCNLTVCGYYK